MPKKKTVEQPVIVIEPFEETVEPAPLDNLKACLKEIKNYEGVIGYMLRNSTSATIDLQDPSKLLDYAIISSASFDAGETLSKIFNLENIKETVVSGKTAKMLSLTIGENKVSVFMEKNADLNKVSEKIRDQSG